MGVSCVYEIIEDSNINKNNFRPLVGVSCVTGKQAVMIKDTQFPSPCGGKLCF